MKCAGIFIHNCYRTLLSCLAGPDVAGEGTVPSSGTSGSARLLALSVTHLGGKSARVARLFFQWHPT